MVYSFIAFSRISSVLIVLHEIVIDYFKVLEVVLMDEFQKYFWNSQNKMIMQHANFSQKYSDGGIDFCLSHIGIGEETHGWMSHITSKSKQQSVNGDII